MATISVKYSKIRDEAANFGKYNIVRSEPNRIKFWFGSIPKGLYSIWILESRSVSVQFNSGHELNQETSPLPIGYTPLIEFCFEDMNLPFIYLINVIVISF